MQSENICTEKLPIRSRATGLLDWTEHKQIETPMLVPFCSLASNLSVKSRIGMAICMVCCVKFELKTSKCPNWPGGQ